MDPRAPQIAALGLFAVLGEAFFRFDLDPLRTATIFAVALGVQSLGGRLTGQGFDPLSPLITALSLTLLLRAAGPGPAAMAAGLAVGSKFLLRLEGGHVFNPANFGLCVTAYLLDSAWISPGQWGSAALMALVFGMIGLAVSGRAGRLDCALVFLIAWAAVLFGRAAWLGDPWAIPIHQMQSGALLLFTFFMISDPKTTPRRRSARILFAICVAAVAAVLTFRFYEPLGVIYALFLCAPLTPLFNRLLPAAAYVWTRERTPVHA